MTLVQEKCVPCKGGTPPLTRQEAGELAVQTPEWKLGDRSIEREFRFRDFQKAMEFVNQVAAVADEEDHHPDIHIYYNKVRLELLTHKIGGLSKNDFILAAKIDQLVQDRG